MENLVNEKQFWSGRRVFITGHTGFKGSWLSIWLHAMGAQLHGYSLAPPTEISLFETAGVEKLLVSSIKNDVRNLLSLRAALEAAQPDIVFHLAAQPLVQDSYRYPVETYSTNVMGTVNLFEALRSSTTVRAVVNVTTDKVYENKEWFWGYREIDALGGYDPYSNSKACSELVTTAYRSSFFHEKDYQAHRVAIATARSGNVIGGGDWARNRLFPDCIRAFSGQENVLVRNPDATRPWQHVLDPLYGYMRLARKLLEEGPKYSGSWNFSPDAENAKTVSWVVQHTATLWGENAGFVIDSTDHPHEASTLMLDNSKARSLLGWKSRWDAAQAIERAVEWFKLFRNGHEAYRLCRSQIERFEGAE